jgi:hydrogenase maturation protease
MSSMKTVILGLGNPLLGDEGVGVHAAHALMEDDELSQNSDPDRPKVLDVGTAVLEALPDLERAERVIILDAVKAGRKPGTLYRMAFSDCARQRCIASVHGFDLSRVLAMARRLDEPEVVVFGVEPALIDWSTDLSPAVASALPQLLKAVRRELSPPAQRG